MAKPIDGFSKLSKAEKIDYITSTYTKDPERAREILATYWHPDPETQALHDEFAENTLTNYFYPFGIAPNFKINGKIYAIPMATEESSVVAAASNAAKYWLDRGGFRVAVLGTQKVGQVHFMYHGDGEKLAAFFKRVKPILLDKLQPLTQNMRKRGGGISSVSLVDKTDYLEGYFQLHCTFETVDAMGANFINSCLESLSKSLVEEARNATELGNGDLDVVMSILSNYVPNCRVRAEVSCPVDKLTQNAPLSAADFAQKMVRSIAIAEVEPYRAVTHNKGIMNGIDAVVMATGNDFRAVEAGIHAYASRDGSYGSLSHAEIEDGKFHMWLEIPIALGTVGGLTRLHPLVRLALEILDNPSAEELMGITAVAGLAQNFAAMRSLVTTGIQQGHMKMHLMNILNQLGATEEEKRRMVHLFKKRTVSYGAVSNSLDELRQD